MTEKNAKACVDTPTPWFVYIVRCLDHTYYTGITTDPARRLAEHNSARRGARYTRPRRPVVLVYCEPAPTRGAAARREHQIKKMPLPAKKDLIATLLAGDCPASPENERFAASGEES